MLHKLLKLLLEKEVTQANLLPDLQALVVVVVEALAKVVENAEHQVEENLVL